MPAVKKHRNLILILVFGGDGFKKTDIFAFAENKDLIVINRDNFKVVQYKIDTNNYFYKGKELLPANFGRAYVEYGTVEQLDMEDGKITLTGYIKRYNIWLNKKISVFNAKIKEMKLRDRALKNNAQKENKHFKGKSEVKDIRKDTVVFNLKDIGNFDFLDSTRKFYHG